MSSLRRLKITADKYNKVCAESSLCLSVEKVLKLKDLMMTNAGKEAKGRHQIVVDVLYHFFDEEEVPEWKKI